MASGSTRLGVAIATVAVAILSLLLAHAELKRTGTPVTRRDILALIHARLFPAHGPGDQSHLPLLRLLASSRMAWGRSTTPIPISEEAVIAKAMLARRWAEVPRPLRPAGWEAAGAAASGGGGGGGGGDGGGGGADVGSDTLSLTAIRDFLSGVRLAAVSARCARARACNVNEVDPVFGLTPLHLAAAAVDDATYAYLVAAGAREDVTDLVGRPPRNLTYAHFVRNARAAAVARGDADCELPVVTVDGGPAAWSEIRRLVGEGEPVLMRGALRHVLDGGQAAIDGWSADAFVAAHGDEQVTVGAVPYAAVFGLAATKMRLADYYATYVQGATTGGTDGEGDWPLYVFEQSPEAAAPGYAALTRLVTTAFPCPGLIAHPREVGAASVHFFLGRAGSGAPAHIHADAVNAVVAGAKRWYVSPPAATVYSRTPVAPWAAALDAAPVTDATPLRCTQRPGDVVYVPGEWGHAVVNQDEDTFGWAMELLNRRDTYAHLAPREGGAAGRVKPV